MDEQFYFDEFFSDDNDPGIEIQVTIKGKQVPVRIRRGLSIQDKAEAEAKAMKTHMGPNGLVLDGVDEAAMMQELLFRAILDWPFTYGPKHPQAGQKVPVTRENIMRLLGGAEEIIKTITLIDKQGENALAPFETASPAA